MCVESHWGLSANYRLKSDREKLEGKGTAARCCGYRGERRKERRRVQFLGKSSNPLLEPKNKIQSSWCPPRYIIPFQHPPPCSSSGTGGQRLVPDGITTSFTGRSILSLMYCHFLRGAYLAARAGHWDLPRVKQVQSQHTRTTPVWAQ